MAKRQKIDTELMTDATPIELNLPPPLDKPMEPFNPGFTGELTNSEILATFNELIERHNALLDVVRRACMKM